MPGIIGTKLMTYCFQNYAGPGIIGAGLSNTHQNMHQVVMILKHFSALVDKYFCYTFL